MTAAASPSLPEVDVLIESDLWDRESDSGETVRRAIAQAATMVDEDVADTELAVMLTDDASIRTLNRQWRGFDKATNVLSFPAADAPSDATTRHLGDIVIAFETVAREAGEESKPFSHHLSHLAIHGFLHLLGHDHETERDAEIMEQLERAILAQLGVPDPYRAQETGKNPPQNPGQDGLVPGNLVQDNLSQGRDHPGQMRSVAKTGV